MPEVEGSYHVGAIQVMFAMAGFCLVTSDGSLEPWKVSLLYSIGLCLVANDFVVLSPLILSRNHHTGEVCVLEMSWRWFPRE